MLTQESIFNSNTEEMPITKIEAFFQEFPWLGNFSQAENIKKIFIQRIEPKLLSYHCLTAYDHFELLPWEVFEAIYFLDENGSPFQTIDTSYSRKWLIFGKKIKKEKVSSIRVHEEENVYSAIKRLGENKNKVIYILSCFPFMKVIIIYKIPGNTNLDAWLKEERKKECDLLKIE